MKKFLKIKHVVKIVLSIVVLVTLQTCERDDICAESTPTTPRLLIEFYDADSPEDLKNVPILTLYGEDLITDPMETYDETIVYNANANTAELPLQIGEEGQEITTRYVLEKDTNLRLDTDNTTDSNIDILEIRYTTEFVYVSRACGYKSIFNDLIVVRENDGDNWISSIQIEESIERTVENENTVHVRIYH